MPTFGTIYVRLWLRLRGCSLSARFTAQTTMLLYTPKTNDNYVELSLNNAFDDGIQNKSCPIGWLCVAEKPV